MEDATQKPARIGLAELEGLVGRQLGSSRWHRISQQEIDKFAEATGDFQPIHVDPQAARNGPYGKTIAHGFLTLSLVASLTPEAFEITDAQSLINYGVNRVRFPVGDAGQAQNFTKGRKSEAKRERGGGSIDLDITPEAQVEGIVRLSGAQPAVDIGWRISSVGHKANRAGGSTTGLEVKEPGAT